ncbi:hypothetical protein O4G76_09000 [Limimaricola sp. G21655-S1]|uniref:hypothetical protein n=1 Tax=Limimaricola sp. G21655-S1 TaxID=3014768 RepID=UPI0022AEA21E|nr:hypothetical protein [Limimaricola sp. G21655-S1]MCZ4260972.1 hypothetical protein [Limimaricola sp. G21655-S1]
MAGALALAACTSQTQLETTAFQRQFSLAENYQAVYARSNSQMRECFAVGMAEFNVDGQLYPELGYGEIIFGVNGMFGYQPYNQIRIDKNGTGATVSLKSLTQTPQSSMNWLEYWTKGGQRCPRISYAETPPAL